MTRERPFCVNFDFHVLLDSHTINITYRFDYLSRINRNIFHLPELQAYNSQFFQLTAHLCFFLVHNNSLSLRHSVLWPGKWHRPKRKKLVVHMTFIIRFPLVSTFHCLGFETSRTIRNTIYCPSVFALESKLHLPGLELISSIFPNTVRLSHFLRRSGLISASPCFRSFFFLLFHNNDCLCLISSNHFKWQKR